MTAGHYIPNQYRGAVPASRLVPIALGVVLVAAAAGWFLLRDSGSGIVGPTATAPAAAPGAATQAAATVPDELTTDQLYREARKAMTDNRLVAPAGNNALEFYLKILAKEPNNAGAADALREVFPFATGAAETDINQGQLDEATRVIELLAKADPSNYTLTILRSKLDAKRKVTEREQAQQVAAAAAAARPAAAQTAATAAATPTAEAPAPVSASDAAAARAASVNANSTASTTPAPAAAPPTPAPAAPSGGETHDVEVVQQAQPAYPTQAARNRQQGWVEVEFSVNTDGTVSGARVVNSDPPRVFDREAVRAIERSTFKPRMDNGKAVVATLRRRLEFKFGG